MAAGSAAMCRGCKGIRVRARSFGIQNLKNVLPGLAGRVSIRFVVSGFALKGIINEQS